MYSEQVTRCQLESLLPKLDFEPQYHSREACQSAITELDALVDRDNGKLTRPLSSEEIRWVRNERIICKHDFRYWATRYAKIKNWDGSRLVPVDFNVAQLLMLDVWSDLEEREVAIMLQQLKARQLGCSTLWELAIGHRVQFWPNVNAVIASSDPDKSEKMSEMIEIAYNNQPWWMLPDRGFWRAGQLFEFKGMGSAVSIQHGTQFSGIARGTTPAIAHLSELPDFDNPELLVDAALLKAMHESVSTMLGLESTAAGRHNWWHNTWEYNKENWPRGRSRLRPVFLPWFVGTDIYPTPAWLRAHPIPDNWQPLDITVAHSHRARDYAHSNDLLKKYLGSNWQMPPEQMWYWEVEHEEYAAKKELAQFYQEMPADDNEAFQSTAISVFDIDTIQVYREHVHEPIAVYGFQGRDTEIPLRMQPSLREIDPNLERIEICAHWITTQQPLECTIVPLKWQGYSTDDGMGKLYVWEWPERGFTYGLGIDTGDGIGKDRTVIEGHRKMTLNRNGGQVCEFASPYISGLDLWPFALAIGTLYSTENEDGGLRQPRAVIECRGTGDACQLEMRKRGWSNFHPWQRYDDRKISQHPNKLGWYTNAWSRPLMMQWLVKFLRDGLHDIHSPWFINEMADLCADEERQALRADYGGHDDRLCALAFLLVSFHALELQRGDTATAFEMLARRRAASGNDYQPPASPAETDQGSTETSLYIPPGTAYTSPEEDW